MCTYNSRFSFFKLGAHGQRLRAPGFLKLLWFARWYVCVSLCVHPQGHYYYFIILYYYQFIHRKGGTKSSKPVRGASLTQHTCYNDKITKQRTSYIYT